LALDAITLDLDAKAPLSNPIFTGTVSGITQSMVGLENVDNTSDLNKPVSTATQLALDATVSNLTETISELETIINSLGDTTITDLNTIINTLNEITLDLDAKAPLSNPIFTGTVSGITQSMVGLENVDNTSDLNKPISTATQSALNAKAPLSNPIFTGTVSGITKNMVGLTYVDNTSDLNKPISTATQSALDEKLNLAGGILTGHISLHSIGEKLNSVTISSNTCTLNMNVGNIFYIPSTVTANFTVNITNVPVDTSCQYTVVLLYQGNFYGNSASATNVSSSTLVANAAPKWAGSNAPVIDTAAMYIQLFTIVSVFSTKYILSNVTSFE
jgi:hypothetical protein